MNNVDLTLSTKVVQVGNLSNSLAPCSSKHDKQTLSKAIHDGIHDIRSPLCVIKPYIKFLKQIDDKEKMNSILDRMNLSVQKVESIIKGIVEYSDLILLDSPPSELVHLKDIFRYAESQLVELMQDTNAKIEIDYGDVQTISYPKVYLQKVILCLLENAIKYKHPNRTPLVKVVCQKVNEKVLISIEDNGEGIEKEQLEMLGTPFTKNKKDSARVGLGLAMVKAIASKNGGFYKIHSVSGDGTNILLFLEPYK